MSNSGWFPVDYEACGEKTQQVSVFHFGFRRARLPAYRGIAVPRTGTQPRVAARGRSDQSWLSCVSL
ncbi:MAG: hypothetical protein IPF68_16435 [Bacteroidales bacterium]|nr:hypothetical protein [Bacteroidales bacterium]